MEPSETFLSAPDDDSKYVTQPIMANQSWMQHTERELKAVRSDLDAHRQFQHDFNDQLHNRFNHVHKITVDIRSELKYMQSHMQEVTQKVKEIDDKLEQQYTPLRQLLTELTTLRNVESQPVATQVIQDD